MARVLALFEDLLLGSNVQGMLRAAGHDVELCSQESEVWEELPDSDVLVVDLGAEGFDGVVLVDSLAAGGELRGVRTVGVYSHVDAETRRRATEAGFDLVVPRSRMAREGGDLVSSLAGAPR